MSSSPISDAIKARSRKMSRCITQEQTKRFASHDCVRMCTMKTTRVKDLKKSNLVILTPALYAINLRDKARVVWRFFPNFSLGAWGWSWRCSPMIFSPCLKSPAPAVTLSFTYRNELFLVNRWCAWTRRFDVRRPYSIQVKHCRFNQQVSACNYRINVNVIHDHSCIRIQQVCLAFIGDITYEHRTHIQSDDVSVCLCNVHDPSSCTFDIY